jgi:hypothetical protein
MKALTIQQPWAWAIAAGHKTVENRTWPTSYRGPLAIHAGKSTAWEVPGRREIEALGIPVPANLTKGVILGVCDLVDVVRYDRCRELHADPWAGGPWCWRLENFRALDEPFPCRGAQGLFEADLPAEWLETAGFPF